MKAGELILPFTALGKVAPSLHLGSIIELALDVGITPELSQGHDEYKNVNSTSFLLGYGPDKGETP